MNRAHVFNLLYFLTELKTRDDIIRAIITKYGAQAGGPPSQRRDRRCLTSCAGSACLGSRRRRSLNYEDAGHPRVILSKVMSSSSKRSRLFATDFMRLLCRAQTNEVSDWGVRLLHTQVRRRWERPHRCRIGSRG